MKRILFGLLLSAGFYFPEMTAQISRDYSKIDIMLIRGDYNKVIDTCKQLLITDSLNSEIYFKMGLAYQNILPDDKSSDCFLRAAEIDTVNNLYRFIIAKGYYNKNKNNQAKQLLENLCSIDSMNWTYAYYLTSIYLQEGRYDESIKIYNRFYKSDTANYIYIDKIGFACLKKGDFSNAIDLFSRSLAINDKNVNAIKNLSYLYASTNKTDTALQLLSRGILTDPADLDLYARRAALNFALNYTKRALDDYLKILSTGDSSILYLKRAGIGYANNLQPKEALEYLLLAYKKDSSDYETMDYLARSYHKLSDHKRSIYYYDRIIKVLTPISLRLGTTYIMLAEELKSDGNYTEAITAYLRGQRSTQDPNINMIIANIYDEKLNDIPKAITYYQLFLDNIKNGKAFFSTDYTESVKKRLEFLKEKQQLPKK